MGFAASQARLLLLTARKSDLEFRAQQITNAEMMLAMQSEEIANEYARKLSNQTITIIDGNKELPMNYANLAACGYTVQQYVDGEWTTMKGQSAKPKTTYTLDTEALNKAIESLEKTAPAPQATTAATTAATQATSAMARAPKRGVILENAAAEKLVADEGVADKVVNASTGTKSVVNTGAGIANRVAVEKIADTATVLDKTIAEQTTTTQNTTAATTAESADIATLKNLKSTLSEKEFKNLKPIAGIDISKYYIVDAEPTNIFAAGQDLGPQILAGINRGTIRILDAKGEEVSVHNGTGFAVRYDTSDDEIADAEYRRKTSALQVKEKRLQMELTQVEAQQKACENEMESVKKIMDKNIEKTFKVFS